MQYPWDVVTNYLACTYGGKRGLAMAGWHVLRSWAGCLDLYKGVDWQRISRVVFVCKGNICRSPFASNRFRGFGIEAASAGLEADPGKPADARAIRAAQSFGTDLLHHRSTHISALELRAGDLLVAFEPEHADTLRHLCAGQPGVQVTLIGLWGSLPRMPYLHDPYGLAEAYFEICFRRIDQGLKGLRRRLSDAGPTKGTLA